MNPPKPFTEKFGLLSDHMIRSHPGLKIEPFVDKCPGGVISYGLTSFGYDLRIDRHYRVFLELEVFKKGSYVRETVDPKRFNSDLYRDHIADYCDIPPHGFALAKSVEHITMPRDLIALCCGKSTYARCGLIVNVTPLEPEWSGDVTLELSNTTPCPVRVYSGEGICQVMFFKSPFTVECSYADKKGIYQNQSGITLPRIKQ